MRLLIPAPLYDQMIDHAMRDLPREVVGLLGGSPDGRVARVLPLLNLAGSKAFFADPYAQYQAERALRDSNIVVLADYHSHPEGSASLSPDDLAFAHPHLIQIVIAVRRMPLLRSETRAYQIVKTGLVEVPVLVE
jgi:proteasome lid subunit RPN8/RPN11